jgi:hypothetical protein
VPSPQWLDPIAVVVVVAAAVGFSVAELRAAAITCYRKGLSRKGHCEVISEILSTPEITTSIFEGKGKGIISYQAEESTDSCGSTTTKQFVQLLCLAAIYCPNQS